MKLMIFIEDETHLLWLNFIRKLLLIFSLLSVILYVRGYRRL